MFLQIHKMTMTMTMSVCFFMIIDFYVTLCIYIERGRGKKIVFFVARKVYNECINIYAFLYIVV